MDFEIFGHFSSNVHIWSLQALFSFEKSIYGSYETHISGRKSIYGPPVSIILERVLIYGPQVCPFLERGLMSMVLSSWEAYRTNLLLGAYFHDAMGVLVSASDAEYVISIDPMTRLGQTSHNDHVTIDIYNRQILIQGPD